MAEKILRQEEKREQRRDKMVEGRAMGVSQKHAVERTKSKAKKAKQSVTKSRLEEEALMLKKNDEEAAENIGVSERWKAQRFRKIQACDQKSRMLHLL